MPCKYAWSAKGCAMGTQCTHCHFHHEKEAKDKTRLRKDKRACYRKLLQEVAAARGQTLLDKKEPAKIELTLDPPVPASTPLQSPPVTSIAPPPGLELEFS